MSHPKCVRSAAKPGDGLDNDCDGIIDEEVKDDKDDDNDGETDEDIKLVREEVKLVREVNTIKEYCGVLKQWWLLHCDY